MNVGHTKQGRPDWYDRTPKTIVKQSHYDGINGPLHFVDWTYTVPTNRKAYFQAANLVLVRQTADAVLNTAEFQIDVQKVDFTIGIVLGVANFNNAVGSQMDGSYAGAGLLNTGESVFGQLDFNGTGLFFIEASVYLSEFDE